MQIETLLTLLGVNPREVEQLLAVPRAVPREEGLQLLADLKEKVRRNWRKLAFELHPDRTGNDPEKTAQFRALLLLKDKFEQMTLPEPSATRVAPVPTYVTVMPPTPGVVYGQVRLRPAHTVARKSGHVAATMKP